MSVPMWAWGEDEEQNTNKKNASSLCVAVKVNDGVVEYNNASSWESTKCRGQKTAPPHLYCSILFMHLKMLKLMSYGQDCLVSAHLRQGEERRHFSPSHGPGAIFVFNVDRQS